MNTEIIKIDKNNIDQAKINHGAEILLGGGLVAFPTETVYGLGANALEQSAVQKTYEAKGRPSDNPLIVHIADISALQAVVSRTPPCAALLMEAFWPGPLTLVMERSPGVPDIITGGLDTVAVRMPDHPIALALIRAAGVPLSAPSANSSGRPSPTRAEDVAEDLMGKVDAIIDGGAAQVGVESTVLDITVTPPVILRPGGVTLEQLQEVLGEISVDPALAKDAPEDAIPRAPGMKYAHYSPKAEVIIVRGSVDAIVHKINEMAGEYHDRKIKAGVLTTLQTDEQYTSMERICLGDRDKPETMAANLFRAMRDFDRRGVQVILAEGVDEKGIGAAIMNRMSKAAGYHIIEV